MLGKQEAKNLTQTMQGRTTQWVLFVPQMNQTYTTQLHCSIDQSIRVDWDLNTALQLTTYWKVQHVIRPKIKHFKEIENTWLSILKKMNRLDFCHRERQITRLRPIRNQKETSQYLDLLCPYPCLWQQITIFESSDNFWLFVSSQR